LAGGLAGALPAAAGEGPAVALLERAREAAAVESFSGVVVVEWHDGRRSQRAEVPVQSAAGVFRFGDEVVGSGARRLVRGPDGWLTLWRHDVIALGPSPAAKYDLSVAPGPAVAGRATEMLEVRVAAGAAPVERLYADRDSGLILRRELLDARGQPYRSLRFVSLRAGTLDALAAPTRSAVEEPAEAGHVDPPYRAPTTLGAGYRLVGTYEKPHHVIHLFYTDGLHGLSVFEQRGHLSASAMPAGGRRVELDGRTVRTWSTPAGETVVWESDGVVYTVVSDASRADVASAVGDLPHSQRPKRLRRVAEVVVSLFRWR
jgi:sigma-E factor negative regulatory protein RseB